MPLWIFENTRKAVLLDGRIIYCLNGHSFAPVVAHIRHGVSFNICSSSTCDVKTSL